MKIFKRNSLTTRLIFILITAILSINFILALYTYNKSRKEIYETIYKDTKNITARLSNSLIFPIWNLDKEEIIHVVNLESTNKQIACILLYNEENQLINGLVKDTDRKVIEYNYFIKKKVFFGNLLFKHSYNINKNKNIIGRVEVYVSDYYLTTDSVNTFIHAMIKSIILSFFLIGIIYFSIKFLLINRLNQLQNVILHLEDFDNPDIFKNINFNRKDELALLGQTLKNMSNKIFSKNMEIHQELKNRKNAQLELKQQNEKMESTNKELAETIWLIESQNTYNDLIVKITNFDDFIEITAKFITEKLSAPLVTILRTISSDSQEFERLFKIGILNDEKKISDYSYLAQIVKNKKYNIIDFTSIDNISIATSSINIEVKKLLLFPITIVNNKSILIEVGTLTTFTHSHLELLKGISRSIAITFENLAL